MPATRLGWDEYERRRRQFEGSFDLESPDSGPDVSYRRVEQVGGGTTWAGPPWVRPAD